MSVPSNLVEALVAWADGHPSMVEWFPGGFYQGLAPVGTTTPYMVFVQTDSRPINIIGRTSRVEFLEIALEARAARAEDARRVGERARELILHSEPLSYLHGSESGRHLGSGEMGELEEGMGIDGSDVWVHRIPITFITASWGTNG